MPNAVRVGQSAQQPVYGRHIHGRLGGILAGPEALAVDVAAIPVLVLIPALERYLRDGCQPMSMPAFCFVKRTCAVVALAPPPTR